MKKYLFSSILLFISILGHSQYENWCTAKIFLKDGIILKGEALLTMNEAEVGIPFSFGSKEFLKYINVDLKQRTSTKFTPQEVEKIIFDVSYKNNGRRLKRQATYVTIIKSENKKKTNLGFAELIIDGTVKLVRRTVINNRGSIYEESLFLRNNEEAVIFNYFEFKSFLKRASEYFIDCPSLVSKIEDKKYTRKDLEEIVKYYNESCAK